MKKRKLVSLVLAALMLLGCLACSSAAPAASSEPDAATKKITFTVVADDKSEVFDLVTTEETLGAALLPRLFAFELLFLSLLAAFDPADGASCLSCEAL